MRSRDRRHAGGELAERLPEHVHRPDALRAVGLWCDDLDQVGDAEVVDVLDRIDVGGVR